MEKILGMAIGTAIVFLLLTTGFALGTIYERDQVKSVNVPAQQAAPAERVQMTVQFIDRAGEAARVTVLDPGDSDIGDLLGVFQNPELFLEFSDARAALFRPGDQTVVWCDKRGPAELRFSNCSMLPVVNGEP